MSLQAAPQPARTSPEARGINRLAAWIARHWLALFNLFLAGFLGLAIAAPLLMRLGAVLPARVIYFAYGLTCHQLPERSFFLFGPHTIYGVADLERLGVVPPGIPIWQRQMLRVAGSPEVGYKIALCQRDLAIYGAMLLSGLIFALGRARLRSCTAARLPWWAFLAFLLPALIDGGTQLLGWRESNYVLRLLTGSLFGLGVVWLAYPYVNETMDDVLHSAGRKTGQNPPHAL